MSPAQGCEVLAFSPHPDDTELGCGAALALAARGGARVLVASLTSAERSSRGSPDLRRVEAARADQILGVAQRVWLGLPDTAVGRDPAHREVLVEVIRRLRPAVVLAPWWRDRHPDHAAAGRLAREACELAGLAGVPGGQPFRPRRLYHYFIHDLAGPSFVLDASEVWPLKRQAMEAYRSQFDSAGGGVQTRLTDPDFLPGIEARARVWGQAIGVRYGEGLLCAGPVGLSGLPGLSPDM